jgi:hypothetical protein
MLIHQKNDFHVWLGKTKDDPITRNDIKRGLKSDDPNVRELARNAQDVKDNEGSGRRPS